MAKVRRGTGTLPGGVKPDTYKVPLPGRYDQQAATALGFPVIARATALGVPKSQAAAAREKINKKALELQQQSQRQRPRRTSK